MSKSQSSGNVVNIEHDTEFQETDTNYSLDGWSTPELVERLKPLLKRTGRLDFSSGYREASDEAGAIWRELHDRGLIINAIFYQADETLELNEEIREGSAVDMRDSYQV